MPKSRKDNKGRALRKGETQRSCDGKYVYTYTDPEGRRRSIYSKDIVELRQREAQLVKDQLDGLDTYVSGRATVNFVFDRHISTKSELRGTTMRNYKYMYDRFARKGFGKKKIAVIKYSDVLQFYQHLLKEKDMQINTLETIHTVLHPTFQLAVRDDIIRNNPSDGVMAQIKKAREKSWGKACLDRGTAKSIYKLCRKQPCLFSLDIFFQVSAWDGMQNRGSNRDTMG